MDRREFFTRTRKKNTANYRTVAAGLNPYSSSWTVNEVAHLLKRTMFGAKKAGH